MLINLCRGENLRVLMVAPDTPNLPNLSVTADGSELAAIRDQPPDNVHVDALVGTVLLTGRWSLSDALRDGNYSTLHLITHGNSNLVQLTTQQVSADTLARLLSQHNVNSVLAMTCDSLPFAHELVALGTPTAIGTIGEIENEDARTFAREFYGMLAKGNSVQEGVDYARSRMKPEAAERIKLLPAEDVESPVEPLMIEIRNTRRAVERLSALVEEFMGSSTQRSAEQATQQQTDMRSLVRAVTALTEVLAR